MTPSKRIVAGIASAVLVVGVAAGLAEAAQKSSGQAAAGAAAADRPGRGPGPGATAIADYLRLSAAELRPQPQPGKALADIANAHGKTVSGREDGIVADAKTHLDADVAAGRLTAAQEATMLADLKAHVDDFVDGVAPPRGFRGNGGPGGGPFDLTAVIDYLGMTAAQLRTQLEAGKSLADVAKAQGKTVSGLEDAIVAAATKKLDAAVAAGTLTAAQEATMLADLKSQVDDMVNRKGPPPRGPRHRHGEAGPSRS